MKRKKRFVALVAAFAITVTGIVSEPAQTQAARPSCCSQKEWNALRLTNEKRMANGLLALSTFGDLQDAATVRAQEIVTVFDHQRPDGSDSFTAFTDIFYLSCAENIAGGQKTAAEVIDSWWNSSGHRSNMLGESYSHVGVACITDKQSTYGTYWTEEFVGGCQTKKIAVNNKNKVVKVKKGTSVRQMNRYVKVTCSKHGTSYMPLSAKMCSGYQKNKLGRQKITVRYVDCTTTFTVKVVK